MRIAPPESSGRRRKSACLSEIEASVSCGEGGNYGQYFGIGNLTVFKVIRQLSEKRHLSFNGYGYDEAAAISCGQFRIKDYRFKNRVVPQTV